jgi:hypothetical protein
VSCLRVGRYSTSEVHKINLGFPHGHRKLAAGPNAKNSRYPVVMLFFLQPVEQWTTNLNGRRVVYFREVENDKSSTSKSKWDKGLILSLSYSMRYVMMLVFQTKHRELYVNPERACPTTPGNLPAQQTKALRVKKPREIVQLHCMHA